MRHTLTLILFTLLLSACYPLARAVEVARPAVIQAQPAGPLDAGTATPAPEKIATLIPASDSTPTAAPQAPTPTYRSLAELGIPASALSDAYAGFAIDYPSGWQVTDVSSEIKAASHGYTLSLRSPQPAQGDKTEGIQPGSAAIDITIYSPSASTLDEAVAARRAELLASVPDQPAMTIQSESAETLASGLPAYRFVIDLGRSAPDPQHPLRVELITLTHGRVVIAAGFGDLTLFDAIAGSLRALE